VLFRSEKGNFLLFICDVSLWVGSKENSFGPIPTLNAIIDDKGRLDDDACKKAVTDGLSKLFSHLGFSADVYLGMLDGNKYASGHKTQPKRTKPPVREPQPRQEQPVPSASAPTKVQNLTEEQVESILNLQQSLGVDNKALSTHLKAKYGASFPNVPASRYQSICVWLKEQGKNTAVAGGNECINELQLKRFWVIARQTHTDEQISRILALDFGLDSSRNMLRKDYDRICKHFQDQQVRHELAI